ncbi:ABC transporter ATP-binding protein [Cyanobacterium stanieri LEGE 03274]|uniref:ABC transporter ATP-binding protein n=1 Tax=Cyanobacterium stanieri LEGE 03274 TaxID=1828756 RepID=A0ABR9V2M9_9CHRO|nr:ABC transporter ATP-binding protein [Cyanobacterium stanieri]MBE9221089.1 ABC transporter ATP-binding protein [Cyanobacterium stanieri LEGE 03274]
MAQVIIDNLYKSYSSSRSKLSNGDNLGVIAPTSIPANDEQKKIPSVSNTNVLRGINLEIREGEFMVLVGPSGCGKSTLLRLIAGLEEISAGKIIIGDRTVNNLPPKSRDIAMVFQNYALYPHLRVYDNIAFGLRRMNPDKKKFSAPKILGNLSRVLPPRFRFLSDEEKSIQAKVLEVAQLLQIDHLLDRLPKQLSGGQKQRVALGRAIARNPQAFLMDEPLSNLDAKLRTETRSQIVTLQKQLQVTTIYVTHDQTEAMTMGDRIAIMNNGEIQQVATPLEVYRQPANKFVAQFIGSPPMNFLEVDFIKEKSMIVHECFKFILTQKWLDILSNYNYEKIDVGIRPEHFYISNPGESSLSCTINLIESLGNETLLKVLLNNDSNQTLQVRIFGDNLFNIGDKINLGINLDKVSFFDAYQGKNIYLK